MAQQSSSSMIAASATVPPEEAASVPSEVRRTRMMARNLPKQPDQQPKQDSMPQKPRRVLEKQFESIRHLLLEEESDLKTAGQWSERLQSHLRTKAKRHQEGANLAGGNGSGTGGEESNPAVCNRKSSNQEQPLREGIQADDASIMVGGDTDDNSNNLSSGKWLQMGKNNNKEQGKNSNNVNMASQNSLALSAVAGGLLEGSSSTFDGVSDFLENNKSGGSDQIKLAMEKDGQGEDFLVTRPKAPQKYGTRHVIKPMLSGQLAEFRKFRSGATQKSSSSGDENFSQEKGTNNQRTTTSQHDTVSESGESQLTEEEEITSVFQDANPLENKALSSTSQDVSIAQSDSPNAASEDPSSMATKERVLPSRSANSSKDDIASKERVLPSRNANNSKEENSSGRGRMRETLQRTRSRSLTDLRAAIKSREGSNKDTQQKDDLENEIEQRRQKFAAKLKEASAHQKRSRKKNITSAKLNSTPIDDSLGQMFDADDDDFFVDKIGAKKQPPSVGDSSLASAPKREIQSMRGERTSFSSLRDTETTTTFRDDSLLGTPSNRKGQSIKHGKMADVPEIAPAPRREIQSMRGERTTFSSLLTTTKPDTATSIDEQAQSTKYGKSSGAVDAQSTINDIRKSTNGMAKDEQQFGLLENSFVLHESTQFEQSFTTSADRDTITMFHESLTLEALASPRQKNRKSNTMSMPILNASVSLGLAQERSASGEAMLKSQPVNATPRESRKMRRRHSSSSLQESSHHKPEKQDMATPRTAKNTATGRNEKTNSAQIGLTRPGAPPLSTPQTTPKSNSKSRVRRASTASLQAKPMLGDLAKDDLSVEDEALIMEDANRTFRGLSPPPTDSKPIRRSSLGNTKAPEPKPPKNNEHVNKIRRRRRASISGPSDNKTPPTRASNAGEAALNETSTMLWRRRTSSANKNNAELAAAELQKQMLLSPNRGDRTRKKMTSENIAEVLATPRRRESKGSSRYRSGGKGKSRGDNETEKKDGKQFTPVTPRRVRNQSIQEDKDRSSVRKQRLRRQVSHDNKGAGSDSSHHRRTIRQTNAYASGGSGDEATARETSSLTPSLVRRVSSQQRYQSSIDDTGAKSEQNSSRRQSRTVRPSDDDDDLTMPFTPAGGEAKSSSTRNGSSSRRRSEADLEHHSNEKTTEDTVSELLLSPSKRKDRRSTAHELLKKNEAVLSQVAFSPVNNDGEHSKRPSTKGRSRRRHQESPDNDVNIGGKNDNGSVRKGRRSSTDRESSGIETSKSVPKPTLRRRKTTGEENKSPKSNTYRRTKTTSNADGNDGEEDVEHRSKRSPKSSTRIGRMPADNSVERPQRSTSRSGHNRSTYSRSAHTRSSHTRGGDSRDEDDDEFSDFEGTTDSPGGVCDSSIAKVRSSNNVSVMQGGRKKTQRESNKKGAPEKNSTGLEEGQKERLSGLTF